MKTIGLTTAIAGAALLLGSTVVRADNVVCNEEGDCWRVREVRQYEPSLKLKVYPGDWKWSDTEKDRYRWREARDGHGYWRNGVWVEIK